MYRDFCRFATETGFECLRSDFGFEVAVWILRDSDRLDQVKATFRIIQQG